MAEQRVLTWNPNCAESRALGQWASETLGWQSIETAGIPSLPRDGSVRLVLLDASARRQTPELPEEVRGWLRARQRFTQLSPNDGLRLQENGKPPFPWRLSLRECLRSGGEGGARAMIAAYASAPGDWALDLGVPAGGPNGGLEARWKKLAGESADVSTLWGQTLHWFSAPHRLRDFVDLRLGVGPATLRPLAAEAAACLAHVRHPWWRAGPDVPRRPLLMLWGDDGWAREDEPRGDITAVDLWLHDESICEDPVPDSRLRFRPGPGGPWFKTRLRLDLPSADSREQRADLAARLDLLLSAVLNRLLLDGRPLRHFGCTLLYPFSPRSSEDAAALAAALADNPAAHPWVYPDKRDDSGHVSELERQAGLYFLPAMRRLLYAQALEYACEDVEPIREWRLDTGAQDSLSVLEEHAGPVLGTGSIESIRLYRYFNHAHVLAVRVTAAASAHLQGLAGDDPHALRIHSDGPDWWRALAFSRAEPLEEIQALQIARWLAWTRLARILYQTYPEQSDEQKIEPLVLSLGGKEVKAFLGPDRSEVGAVKDTERSRVVHEILGRFFPGSEAASRVLDDLEPDDARLFVNLAYGLAGPPPQPQAARRLFELALYVDRPEDVFEACGGHAYDPNWLAQDLAQASLGLWEANGTYIGATSYSNAHLGTGDFFCEISGPRHVPQMYERMLIQALFYRESLALYSRRISDATKDLTRDMRPQMASTGLRRSLSDARALYTGGRELKDLRRDFIRFTNRYWFHTLTPETQGRALFDLQQKALGLERDYDLIKDEMERTDEYLTAARSDLFTKVAVWVALVALWAAVLPLMPLDGDIGWPVLSWETLWLYGGRVLQIGAVVVVPVLILYALFRSLGKGSKGP